MRSKMTFRTMRKIGQGTIFIAATISLLSTTLAPVKACGPFMDYATFVLEQNPDYPFQRFASGQLGVIKPGYARSYLVVAYRYLSGIKTSPEQQKQFNALWQRRLTNPDARLQKAVELWGAERKKVLSSAPLKDPEVYKWDPYSSSFINYNADAYTVAAETLKNKIAKYGATDKRVTEWVIAQDEVFNVVPPGGQPALAALPADADAESRADRNYQLACKSFYNSKYDDAIKQFEEISQDSTSRWQKWGDYLAARAYCRKGTVDDTPVVADLKKAEEKIDKILSSNEKSPLTQTAKNIKHFIQYRLDPSTRAKDAVAMLTSADASGNLTDALGDYTIILDHILEKPDSEETPTSWSDGDGDGPDKFSGSQNDGASQSGSPTAKTASVFDNEFLVTGVAMVAFVFAALHLAWWRSKFRANSIQIINSIALFLSVAVLSGSIASCAQNADTAKPTNATDTGKAPATEPAKEPAPMPASQVVLDDEMTNWILNFQDKKPQATEKAIAQWKKSNSLPWLVSSISKIPHTSPSKGEIVAAAEKVAADSPAYTTLAYHRVRLLSEAGQTKEASKLLWSVVNSDKNLPPSARNGFYELGASFAGSISEFAKLAAPSPASVCAEDELLPAQVENLEKAETTNNFLTYPGCLTREAANIINEISPVSTMTALANDQTLPAKVRVDIAQAGWVRSVLLKDEKSAMTLTPVLSKLLPQLSKPLAAYTAAPSGDEKDFAALSIILHNPAMRPYVTSGLPRVTPFDKMDSYRDNWWCAEPPTVNHGYDSETGEKKKDPTPTVAFLTSEEKKVGLKQYTDLKALGTAPNLLAKRMMHLSKAKPKDPRFPEFLHIVVSATRYGCTDESTTPFSKQVFQELHRNYPGNPWTKKTKFWF